MNALLLLTLVDHGKPFKGTWQIYKQSESLYSACHSTKPAHGSSQASSCQIFTSHQQVCQFTELLQYYGWSIDGQTAESLDFRQACCL